MDVVVADVPPKYGMLLSRSWGAKLQGTMQMDGTYATIHVFSQLRRLYREAHMKFMVISSEKPKNSPIYSVHTDLDSFILYNNESTKESEPENNDLDNQLEAPSLEMMAVLDMEENERTTLNSALKQQIRMNKVKMSNNTLPLMLNSMKILRNKTQHNILRISE